VLGTVAVTGNLTGTQMRLTQGVDPKMKALGSLTAGQILNAEIRSAGNIGTITTNMLQHSLIFAGVNDSVTARPTAAGDFVSISSASLPVIQSLTVKGFSTAATSAVFINSSVAAGQIVNVELPIRASAIADTDGITQAFGFATRLAKVPHYLGPPSSGDFNSGNDSLIL
jgi:hypothetical protein